MLCLSWTPLRHWAANRSSWMLGASMWLTRAAKRFSAPHQVSLLFPSVPRLSTYSRLSRGFLFLTATQKPPRKWSENRDSEWSPRNINRTWGHRCDSRGLLVPSVIHNGNIADEFLFHDTLWWLSDCSIILSNYSWELVLCRDREKLMRRRSKPCSYYLDMLILGVYWKCFGNEDRVYHHTTSATLLYGLREALAEIAQEGLPASWARHAAAAARLRKGLELRGLRCYVQIPRYQLSTVISIELPPGVDEKIIVQRAMQK